MKNRLSFQTLFAVLLLAISHTVTAENKERDRSVTWVFNKVSSDEPAVDAEQVKALTAQYENTTIKFNHGDEYGITVSIDQICSFDVKHTKGKVAADLLKDKQPIDSYIQLISLEKLSSEGVNLFRTTWDPNKCSKHFSRFIEIKDYLIITDNGLHVMFKRVASDANKMLFRDEFPQYCQDPMDDGTMSEVKVANCSYPDMEIKDVYARLKSMIDFDRLSLFQDEMPLKNKKYEVKLSEDYGNREMSYRWSGSGKLIITQQAEMDAYIYTFERKKGETQLKIVYKRTS